MDQKQIDICAAILAVTNMGLDMPSPSHVKWAKNYYSERQDPIWHFAQSYIESDEQEDMFLEEANMWKEILRKDGEEKFINIYPDIHVLYHGVE